jgi:hypothetical protein
MAAGEFARVDVDAANEGWGAQPWGACVLTDIYSHTTIRIYCQ